MMDKKGQVNKLSGFALTMVVFTVIIAVGLSIMATLASNLDTGSAAQNATNNMITHVSAIVGWIPIIVTALVGSIVLFLVIRNFGGR